MRAWCDETRSWGDWCGPLHATGTAAQITTQGSQTKVRPREAAGSRRWSRRRRLPGPRRRTATRSRDRPLARENRDGEPGHRHQAGEQRVRHAPENGLGGGQRAGQRRPGAPGTGCGGGAGGAGRAGLSGGGLAAPGEEPAGEAQERDMEEDAETVQDDAALGGFRCFQRGWGGGGRER